MRKVGQRYVPYFNRRYGRTGTLWEGRFKSCLVESARYFIEKTNCVVSTGQHRLGTHRLRNRDCLADVN